MAVPPVQEAELLAELRSGQEDAFERLVRALSLVLVTAVLISLATAGMTARYDKAPEFPSQDPKQWIGPPQNWKGLEGKVVILDVWTFG